MLLAFGLVCGIVEARASGQGQVVDAAMVDGAATLMTFFHGYRAMGIWNDERGTNLLDTGAHFYDVYQTSDGGFISLGSIEAHWVVRGPRPKPSLPCARRKLESHLTGHQCAHCRRQPNPQPQDPRPSLVPK